MTIDTTLRWGFKTSFVRYVEGDPSGLVLAEDGALRSDEQFTFPGVSSATEDPEQWCFRGTIGFVAHFGILSLRIRDLRITPAGDSAELSVADAELATGRRTLLELAGLRTHDEVTTFRSAVLTSEGAELFLDSYRPGTPFDVPSITRVHQRQERVS